MQRTRPVTMEAVARHANVSIATVSRALKLDPSVAEGTRSRVLEAATELGYVMQRQARALRLQRTGLVAVHVPFVDPGSTSSLTNPFLLEFLATVGSALGNADLDMLVSHSKSVDLSLHRSGLVDGYIQLGFGLDDSVLVEAAEAGIPLAVWMPPATDRAYCAVGVDNVKLAREATAHLIAGGRRRIALISGDLDDPRSEGFQRYQGYCDALREADIAVDDSIVVSASDAVQNVSAAAAVGEILDADRAIDGVFVAYSDAVAMAAQHEFFRQGISVPDDVAMVGFDNIQMAQYARSPLTTIDQGLADGIGVLIDKLNRQIAGETVTSQHVDGRIVIRESCGARSTATADA
ncbi:LacI family DNA-binding transcriptional regulator [Ilumatobacter coccineus]|uniref:Putative LacI family transcriptional regulator n=1 Tax=Ilumatobacter coccineus (strain NBRC 103263 / KCTC 29153 / YM16-304) TaxID=1313172 RepID=A0A6C7EB64_ILUCY|nr:LacI family DNA-binding transcriptional regulator [Ilumatobacter coccineus]BAN03563.1 putative LacI family transcriptional regulator [Ilumatobacter coccineus YM16-304]